jgi:hypothetical protein
VGDCRYLEIHANCVCSSKKQLTYPNYSKGPVYAGCGCRMAAALLPADLSLSRKLEPTPNLGIMLRPGLRLVAYALESETHL